MRGLFHQHCLSTPADPNCQGKLKELWKEHPVFVVGRSTQEAGKDKV